MQIEKKQKLVEECVRLVRTAQSRAGDVLGMEPFFDFMLQRAAEQMPDEVAEATLRIQSDPEWAQVVAAMEAGDQVACARLDRSLRVRHAEDYKIGDEWGESFTIAHLEEMFR